MNISNLRDCSPSEVPNFGTDVPNLRTFLRFFLLSEIRRRRISGRPRKRACAKIHPRSDLHLPRFYTGIYPRFYTEIYPRFSHTYSETYHPSSESRSKRANNEGSEPVVCWRRNHLGLAALSSSSTSRCSVVLGRSRDLWGGFGAGSALECSEETWACTFALADGWLDERRSRLWRWLADRD